MSDINSIYEMKQTILGIVNSNPLGFSDLIDSLYIRAMKETGLVKSEYRQNFEFSFAFDHKLKSTDIISDIVNIITIFIEGVIRDPKNSYILKAIGKDVFIYSLNEYDLSRIINAAITVMDISTNDNTAFEIKL